MHRAVRGKVLILLLQALAVCPEPWENVHFRKQVRAAEARAVHPSSEECGRAPRTGVYVGQVSIPLGDVRGGTARSRVDTCMLNVYRNRRAIFQSSCACRRAFSPASC